MKLSVCIIAKNEELVIERCLKSAMLFADEIILVDTGSTDSTKSIAHKFIDNIYDYKWNDDFSEVRNYAFSKANGDLIMWLDADDVVLEEDAEKIIKLKAKTSHPSAYFFEYVMVDENFNPTQTFRRERLFLKSSNPIWRDPIHEYVEIHGSSEIVDIKVYHKKERANERGRNLKIYKKMIKNHQFFTPRQQFFYAREYYFLQKYNVAIRELKKFLKMEGGWQINQVQACLDISNCYELLGNLDFALDYAIKALKYDLPSGEVLFRLGDLFLKKKMLKEGIFYLENAKLCQIDYNSGAFIDKDCYDFKPNILLCYAYFVAGDVKKAYECHNSAKKIKPNDENVKKNDEFFAKYFENSPK